MVNATTRRIAYSKTTCPDENPKLRFGLMVDEIEDGNPEEKKSAREPGPSVEHEARTRRPFPFWAKLAVMCVLVFLASIGYLRSSHQHAENIPDVQEEPTDVPAVDKRKPVADIELTADGGVKKKLSDFKGHVVLLSFWASWCTPCLVELPTFIDLHEKLSAKGLVIVPLNVDEGDQAATFVGDFWKTKKFPFVTYFDPEHKGAGAFQVDSLPSNFVLDKQGRLVAQGYGANDWSSDASVRFIEQLLSEN